MLISRKIQINILRKQGQKVGLLVSWLPFGAFLIIGLLWYFLIGFKANTLSFWLFCTLAIITLHRQIITMIQVDFLYGKKILEAMFESNWTIPSQRSSIIHSYLQFKNKQDSDLKNLLTSLKKDDVDIYRYIDYMANVIQKPLFFRPHYALKQKVLRFIELAILMFLIIQFSTGLTSKLQAFILEIWPNLTASKVILCGSIVGLYFILDIFLRKHWCNGSGDFGAVLTFIESKKMLKGSIFSKAFVAQYLMNRCLALYGVDPARQDNWHLYFGDDVKLPDENGRYLVFTSQGLDVHTLTSDSREPHFHENYDDFNDYVAETVAKKIGGLQATEYLLLNGVLGRHDPESLELLHNTMTNGTKFIKQDVRRNMMKISYFIPRMFL